MYLTLASFRRASRVSKRLSCRICELLTGFRFSDNQTKMAAHPKVKAAVFSSDGRGGEIRTPDPHNPIVVRYQAALRPDRIT